MKRKLVALLAATLMMTGCSTTESSLLDWVKEAGMTVVLDSTTAAIADVASQLEGLTGAPEDLQVMVTALKAGATALGPQLTALIAEPLSNDPTYEQLRTKLIDSMESYIDQAKALDVEAMIAAGDIAATSAAIEALTAVADQLKALSDYLANNGDSAVGSA